MIREKIAVESHTRASRFPVGTEITLAGARTITPDEIEKNQVMVFDPDGSTRIVTLPAEAVCKGVILFIKNTAGGAEDLTINNDAAATILTVSQNEMAVLACNGTAWYGFVGATT